MKSFEQNGMLNETDSSDGDVGHTDTDGEVGSISDFFIFLHYFLF